jgi:hypothetical protein
MAKAMSRRRVTRGSVVKQRRIVKATERRNWKKEVK